MKILTVILLLFALFSISCSSVDKSVNKNKDINYFKAIKGSYWVYEGRLFNEKKEITVKIIDEENGKLKDDKGLTYLKDKDGYKNQYFYWIKFPLMKGNSWIVKSDKDVKVATIEDTEVEFKFGEDTIKNCIKVSYIKSLEDKGRNIVIRTFCPDLWMVSMRTYYENPDGIATEQSSFILKSFIYR